MPHQSPAIVATALLSALAASGCASSSPLAVKRLPDASLLQRCSDPVLAPKNATDNDIAAEQVRVAQAYVICRERHNALAGWIEGQ